LVYHSPRVPNSAPELCRSAAAQGPMNSALRANTRHSPGSGILPERVDGDAFAQAGLAGGIVAGLLQGGRGEMGIDPPAGKQPFGGACGAIPGAQDLQQARGQHGVTVALTLALLDAQQHTLRIDVRHLEGHHLGDAQAGAVSHHEGGAVANAGDVVEEQRHFLLAENDGGVLGMRARSRYPVSKGASRVTP